MTKRTEEEVVTLALRKFGEDPSVLSRVVYADWFRRQPDIMNLWLEVQDEKQTPTVVAIIQAFFVAEQRLASGAESLVDLLCVWLEEQPDFCGHM
jgi:hypothetical protein